jgi:Helix-turn-helix domain of resolvase
MGSLCLPSRLKPPSSPDWVREIKHSGYRLLVRRDGPFTREQFNKVREMPGQRAVGIAQIAKETGLTRQTVYGSRVSLRVLRVRWRLGGYSAFSARLRRPTSGRL